MTTRPMTTKLLSASAVLVTAAITIFAGSASAGSDDKAEISPLGFLIVNEPHPVLRPDRRRARRDHVPASRV